MVAEYPLTPQNRIRLARAFGPVPRVDLSIDCVLEAQMGRALVDDVARPTAFQIEVGPFCYFAGDAAGPGGGDLLAGLAPWTFLMPSAPGWIEAAQDRYGPRLVGMDRYRFHGAGLSAGHLAPLLAASRFGGEVRPMDLAFAATMWGQDHFVDLSTFTSAADFVERGVGFYVEKRGRVAGAAYSSLVCSRGIEVSLYVTEDYRRQGMATALAARLLLWCLEHYAAANWDAANPPSCRLAEKLGYAPRGSYRAFYLLEESPSP
jgi:GNAT superfamily N-acetyltransferase